jgi:hypothetical protein
MMNVSRRHGTQPYPFQVYKKAGSGGDAFLIRRL